MSSSWSTDWGYELLRAHPEEAPFLHGLLGDTAPATVGVPSTTATSLTSLGTALTPGMHGVVGFTSRIPGTDELLNALFWSKSVDPLVWQPHETAFATSRGRRGAHHDGQQAGLRGVGADPGELAGRGVRRAPTGSVSGWLRWRRPAGRPRR